MPSYALVLPPGHGKTTYHRYYDNVIDLEVYAESFRDRFRFFYQDMTRPVLSILCEVYSWRRWAILRMPTEPVLYLVESREIAEKLRLTVIHVVVMPIVTLVDAVVDRSSEEVSKIMEARAKVLNTPGPVFIVDGYKAIAKIIDDCMVQIALLESGDIVEPYTAVPNVLQRSTI